MCDDFVSKANFVSNLAGDRLMQLVSVFVPFGLIFFSRGGLFCVEE